MVRTKRSTSSLILVALAVAMASCGKSSANASREARLVKEADAKCLMLHSNLEFDREATARRVAALYHEIRTASLYLPAGRSLREAREKRRALLAEVDKLRAHRGVYPIEGKAGAFAVIEQMYELDKQIYADNKALGLGPCLGAPPRAPIGG